MLRKFFCVVLLVISVFALSACNGSVVYEKIPEKTAYDIRIDYVGTAFSESDFVPYVNLYRTLNDYEASSQQNGIVWIEESALDGDYNSVFVLTKRKDKVIVISEGSDKRTLTGKIDSVEASDVSTGNERFVGLLYADFGNGYKDCVGLYSTGQKGAKETEFLAYCSSYDYAKYYQGNNFVTEVYPSVKYADYLNVFNCEDKAYGFNFVTLVDYLEGYNPLVLNTPEGKVYEFQYTVANYSEIVPLGAYATYLEARLDAGDGGYNIKSAPESETRLVKGQKDEWNFLFARFFNMVSETKYNSVVKLLERGKQSQFLNWSVENYDSDFKQLLYSPDSLSITVAADFINLTGRYQPSAGAKATLKYADDNSYECSFGITFDEIAIVWGDDYEE